MLLTNLSAFRTASFFAVTPVTSSALPDLVSSSQMLPFAASAFRLSTFMSSGLSAVPILPSVLVSFVWSAVRAALTGSVPVMLPFAISQLRSAAFKLPSFISPEMFSRYMLPAADPLSTPLWFKVSILDSLPISPFSAFRRISFAVMAAAFPAAVFWMLPAVR